MRSHDCAQQLSFIRCIEQRIATLRFVTSSHLCGVTSTILTVAPVPPWWMKGSRGNRHYRKSFVSSPLWTTRSSSSVSMWLRERKSWSTRVRSDLYRGTGTNPILIWIPWNFREFYEISSMHLRIITSFFDFPFRSIVCQLILIWRSETRTRQICLLKFVQIYHYYLATCIQWTDIGLKKQIFFNIGLVYDFCLKLSILQVITSIPRTRMLDGYRRQGTSRHQG